MDGARLITDSTNCIEIDRHCFVPDSSAVKRLSKAVAIECSVIPISYDKLHDSLWLATQHVNDVLVIEKLRAAVIDIAKITVSALSCDALDLAVSRCYSHNLEFHDVLAELNASSIGITETFSTESHALVRLVDSVFHAAVVRRASDIHIGPLSDTQCRIRFRIDGVLVVWQEIALKHLAAITVRIKILTSMDIAESRLPQDGQCTLQVQGRYIDFRASSFPTIFGENIVLRVLDKRRKINSLQTLLADSDQLHAVRSNYSLTSGLSIICGPTGCGKSTTLLAMLSELDSGSLNIMTLEDPVENAVNGIQQCSIQSAAKFDYAEGVRALLRQDPDILLIGEIRDCDSAAMAFRAALTGHGVFTTVHCRDTESALTRLLDLGIGFSGIASCVNVLIAQRLVRTLCQHCTRANDCREFVSCAHCVGTGYFGRVAVLEVLPITTSVREMLCSNATPAKIWQHALDNGMQSLRGQIDRLIERGVTDQAELNRALGGE
jgi:general secretion pathway protein E/type IV pilus assembly protein PilB